MATIKITITTPRPMDVEVTERILMPDMSREQICTLLKDIGTVNADDESDSC